MKCVYRYTDLSDNIIKYIGVVWGETRTLEQRYIEHFKKDDWCKKRRWLVEYADIDITTRSEAEAIESHLISLYGTDQYYNIQKAGFGINKFLPEIYNWIVFIDESNAELSELKALTKTKKALDEKRHYLIGRVKELEDIKQSLKETIQRMELYKVKIQSNEFIVPLSAILDALRDQKLVYHDFQFGIKTESSIRKWERYEWNMGVAIGIIRDVVFNSGCDNAFKESEEMNA